MRALRASLLFALAFGWGVPPSGGPAPIHEPGRYRACCDPASAAKGKSDALLRARRLRTRDAAAFRLAPGSTPNAAPAAPSAPRRAALAASPQRLVPAGVSPRPTGRSPPAPPSA